jgi:hypothetical protein
MTNIKPLAPGEIRTATAVLDTTIQLMEVSGGSFIQIQIRRGAELLYCRTWMSSFDHLALAEYSHYCQLYNAS